MFRPYLGLKREVFNEYTAYGSISTSILFGQAGLAYEIPITKSTNITIQTDYAEGLNKPDVISVARMTTLQVNFKWGWKK